ncbi:MAG: arsenate reductase (glutaredoxin) [Magnetococcales bacterium]|nr:arsenate reductase (glutaredoxin) [Magnetococcales bacterium]
MSVTLYHNPQCSKCREALALLRARGIEPEIVEYLKTPPTREDLTRILAALSLEPRALLRTKEAAYRDNGLDDLKLSREALIDAMVTHPKLIERPIVLRDGRGVLGRPPAKILELL